MLHSTHPKCIAAHGIVRQCPTCRNLSCTISEDTFRLMEHTHAEPNCSFVICVEKGGLEYKALLLILTLRQNWGPWSKVPLYAYAPREGKEPSDWLKEIYRLCDVTPVYQKLNTDFVDYPLANKPIAMAHAERVLTSETLVFLDTDVLCWHPPTHFNLSNHIDLSLCVDGTKTV